MLPTDPPKKSGTKSSHVYIHMGLEGQDDDIEALQGYFSQMQTMTVETAMDSDIDLLTFALSAHYFGVIMMQELADSPKHPIHVGEDEDLAIEEGGHALPKDLDDAELVELNIPPPITVEQFLALPEKEKAIRWDEAWEAKKKGSLYDDSDFAGMEESIEKRRGKMTVLRPGDIDFYMSDEDEDDEAGSPGSKGKMREPGMFTPWANSHPVETSQFIPASINDHLINWPDDIQSDGGPPSSDDDFQSVSTDNMSESPAPTFAYDQFGFPVDPPVDPNFGREYFEPDTELPLQLPLIPEDPIAKQVVREAALRKIDELRAQTVHLYEKKKARLARRRALEAKSGANNQAGIAQAESSTRATHQTTAPTMIATTRAKPIGLVYLTSSQNFSDPLHKGECNIGVYVAPEYRTLSRLYVALHKAIEDAFRDQDCHRLQAVLVDHPDILDFLNLYTSAGFRQEGIRRRAFFSQLACEWKDVTYLAILATEWIHDHSNMTKAKLLPSNLWEEILSRHQREQEEFIRMEEQKSGTWPGRLKRSISLETIRETLPSASITESGAENSGFTTDASTSSSVLSNSKRIKFSSHPSSIRLATGPKRGSFQPSSESGFESEWDMASAGDIDDADFFSASTNGIYAPGPSSFRFARRSQSASSTWDIL